MQLRLRAGSGSADQLDQTQNRFPMATTALLLREWPAEVALPKHITFQVLPLLNQQSPTK